jgi:23S rRNA (guanosine2251-2'-O)-methyltransferase
VNRRVVFGIGPVRELLRARRGGVSGLWVSRARARGRAGDPLAELVAEAERLGIPVEPRDPAELDEAAGPGAVHQGVVALTGAFRYADLDDVAARAVAAGPRGLVVALDGVTDPHNLGAIARSAYLFGAHGLVLPRDRAAEVTAAAVKASAGATEHLAIAQVTNLARALGELKERGLWTAALAAGPDAIALWQLDAATTPLCLVLGAEGSGIRPLVARQCDFKVAIPMRGSAVGSLNVSVAAGVALYEVARQRALAAERS